MMNHAGQSKICAALVMMEWELREDSHRLLRLMTMLHCLHPWQNQINKAESETRSRSECAEYQ
jgi:hypothetical protein